MQHVVQWSKSAGEQCVLCTVITRMLLDHIRIIVHMDIITCIILLYTSVFFYFLVLFIHHIKIIVHMDISFIILLYTPVSFCALCL
jgi:hypothetical protein